MNEKEIPWTLPRTKFSFLSFYKNKLDRKKRKKRDKEKEEIKKSTTFWEKERDQRK